MPAHEVISLSDRHVQDAASVLVRAFVDDPGLLFVLPDEAERTRLAPLLARAGVRFAVRCGFPLAYAEPVRGVALWFPPDAPTPSEKDLADAGIAAAPGLMGDPAWKRLKTLLDHVDALHPAMAPEPHWYLTVLGVDPDVQRQGVGEALMRPIFDKADRDGVCCYLEAPTDGNARYYSRRGFDVVGDTTIPDSNVHIWFMRREPRVP